MRLESLAATLQIAVSEKCGEDTSQESLDGHLKEFPLWRGKPNVRPTCCPCLSKKGNLPAKLSRGMRKRLLHLRVAAFTGFAHSYSMEG